MEGSTVPKAGPLPGAPSGPPCDLPPAWAIGAVLALVGAVLVALAWSLVRARATLRTLARAVRRGHGKAALRLLANLDTPRHDTPQRGAKPKPDDSKPDDDDEPPTSAPPASCLRPIGRKGPRSAVLPRWRRFDPTDAPMGVPGLAGAP